MIANIAITSYRYQIPEVVTPVYPMSGVPEDRRHWHNMEYIYIYCRVVYPSVLLFETEVGTSYLCIVYLILTYYVAYLISIGTLHQILVLLFETEHI